MNEKDLIAVWDMIRQILEITGAEARRRRALTDLLIERGVLDRTAVTLANDAADHEAAGTSDQSLRVQIDRLLANLKGRAH